MKYYDTNFIKNYIEKNKDTIDHVFAGMREDWSLTEDLIYDKEDGYSRYFDWSQKYLIVRSIKCSIWATPVLEAHFRNGEREIVECYYDDHNVGDSDAIQSKMAFTIITGGGDYLR